MTEYEGTDSKLCRQFTVYSKLDTVYLCRQFTVYSKLDTMYLCRHFTVYSKLDTMYLCRQFTVYSEYVKIPVVLNLIVQLF